MPEQHAVITEEMVTRARSRIGQVWEPREPWYNTQVFPLEGRLPH